MSALREIRVDDSGVEVVFHGLLSVAALRRRIVMSHSDIVKVCTQPFELRPGLIRVAGTAAGRRLHGLFRERGRWLFLSFENPARVVRFSLRREGPGRMRFSEVVIGTVNAEAVVRDVHRHALRTSDLSAAP